MIIKINISRQEIQCHYGHFDNQMYLLWFWIRKFSLLEGEETAPGAQALIHKARQAPVPRSKAGKHNRISAKVS